MTQAGRPNEKKRFEKKGTIRLCAWKGKHRKKRGKSLGPRREKPKAQSSRGKKRHQQSLDSRQPIPPQRIRHEKAPTQKRNSGPVTNRRWTKEQKSKREGVDANEGKRLMKVSRCKGGEKPPKGEGEVKKSFANRATGLPGAHWNFPSGKSPG